MQDKKEKLKSHFGPSCLYRLPGDLPQHTSSRFDWFCLCLLLAALMLVLPISLEAVGVEVDWGRGIWEAEMTDALS